MYCTNIQLKSSIQLSVPRCQRELSRVSSFSPNFVACSNLQGPAEGLSFLGAVLVHRRVAPHPTSGGERHPPTILLSSEIRTPTDSTKSSALKSSKWWKILIKGCQGCQNKAAIWCEVCWNGRYSRFNQNLLLWNRCRHWYTVIRRGHIVMRSTMLKMDLSLLCLIIFSRLGRSYDQPRGGMWKRLQTLHNLKTTMWVMIPWCASTIKIYRYVCYIIRLEQLIASYSSYFSLSVFWPWLSTSILLICQCLQREVFKVTTFIQSSYLCSWVSHFYC